MYRDNYDLSFKGQLISYCLFGKEFNLTTMVKSPYGTSGKILVIHFLAELKPPKRHFEIY